MKIRELELDQKIETNSHIKIENSPEWAKEMRCSVSRLEKTQHENI